MGCQFKVNSAADKDAGTWAVTVTGQHNHSSPAAAGSAREHESVSVHPSLVRDRSHAPSFHLSLALVLFLAFDPFPILLVHPLTGATVLGHLPRAKRHDSSPPLLG